MAITQTAKGRIRRLCRGIYDDPQVVNPMRSLV
jgi:hypothetical protein